jgi:deoxyribose-phosphate aldolase
MIEITNPAQLACYIDHTFLKADATDHDVERVCAEALQYGFAAVCLNPSFIMLASRLLSGSNTLPITVIGFPLGSNSTKTKAFETEDALKNGAKELDMVLHIGAMKAGNYSYVKDDIKTVAHSAGGLPVKVILENCELTNEEIVNACKISMDAGAAFVKTSTGFGRYGAREQDVQLMRATVGKDFGVKASGGIRSYNDAVRMIQAGANRIGTSCGIEIVSGGEAKESEY